MVAFIDLLMNILQGLPPQQYEAQIHDTIKDQ